MDYKCPPLAAQKLPSQIAFHLAKSAAVNVGFSTMFVWVSVEVMPVGL